MRGGRGTRRWAALVALLVATAACSGGDLDGRPEPIQGGPRELAFGLTEVGLAVLAVTMESGASLRDLGGFGGFGDAGLDGDSDLDGYRADTDEAVADAADELGVRPPSEALAGLRAEIDRYVGEWDMATPGYTAAMQPVIGGFERIADGLLDDAERVVGEVEHPRVRRGLELEVAADRLVVRFDTLVAQLLLNPDTGEEPEHLARLTAAWERLDGLAEELRAEGAEPYAAVVAAEFPEELHEVIRTVMEEAAATGSLPDLSAFSSVLPGRGDRSYHSLGSALHEAVLGQIT